MKKICILLASSGLALSIVGCNEGNTPQTTQTKNSLQKLDASQDVVNADTPIVQGAPQDTWVKLGQGVYQPTGLPATAICMKDAATPNALKQPKGHVSLNDQISEKQLKENLNVSVGGKVGWGSFSASASANFVKNVQDDSYTRNFSYLQDFGWSADFEPQDFGNDNLTAIAQKAYAAGVNQFLTYCGDSYVSNATAGALLAVNVKIEFASHQDEQTFNSKMGAKFGIGSITSNIQSSGLNQSMNASISVEALQLGGDTSKLPSIFTKASSGDYYVAKCSFKDLNSCNQIINGILTYAQTVQSQVKDVSGNPIKDRLFYYNPTITNYTDVGIDLTTPTPSREVVSAQAKLQAMVELTNEDLTFVKHYQKSAVAQYFDVDMSNFLKSAEKALSMRQDYLLSHGFDCYTSKDIANCPKLVNEASEVFNTINEYKVDQSKIEYVKYGWYNTFPNGSIYLFAPISLNGNYYSKRIAGDGDLSAKIVIDSNKILHLFGTRTNYSLKFDANMVDTSHYQSGGYCDPSCKNADVRINMVQNPN
ncbi:MAG: hypothetical protein PHC75_02240 [Burkholderiales bacterium]|nr:hypothetical protein [Burkholderiales bacterium]